MSFSPIAVLGAGAWGTAVAVLLARNGQTVRLWDHDTKRLSQMNAERLFMGVALPESLHIEMTLETAVRDVRDICLVVPSHAFRTVLTQLKSLVPSDARFVWGTKGLDPETQSFLHEVVYSVFSPQTPVAVFSGPSFAKEVAHNLVTAVSVAGNNPDFLKSLTERFQNDHFSMYINTDMIGVQLCSVVKNVMAIAVGMCDGMGSGTNTRCALITRGLAEMARLCEAVGGKRETAMSLAGVGDLVLTCTDNQSRNRRFGLAIGEGVSAQKALSDLGESVEGYYNTKQLSIVAKKHGVSMTIADQVYAILYENRPVKMILTELTRHESIME